MESEHSEFIAIYGRRRIGKTFLVTETLGNELDFDMTGVMNGDSAMQLNSFSLSLAQSGYTGKRPKNWIEAFMALREVVTSRLGQRHVVLFIEERLRSRITYFEQETGLRKAVQLTMITTYGLNTNVHSSEVAVSLDMNALFD